MQFVANLQGKFMDYIRVADVFALGGHGHQQVSLYQPGNQFAVPGAEMMALTKILGIFHAQYGMVAASALGDIMIEASNIQ